ncbi:Folylpolyglutamate synthetase [Blastocladiella emersonii ATCC 22665]|nr:Folylpolyglutamate synthetase [Blastocladiella emersonii ATCC 22665]
MASTTTATAAAATRTYHDAIACLNTLQTNAATLAEVRTRSPAGTPNTAALSEMRGFVARAGYAPDDLNVLNLVHVTGTKGKGSTAAFTESLLRHAGEKTGLYTSPHLMEVRERIRIGGKPLAREAFAEYFFEVWDRLEATRDGVVEGPKMPNYFRFLTCLAFHVFMREKTTATILEVGIGGLYDSTNIITRPVATGITSLGYDHVAILGNTLSSIGRQKAGIMKPGVPCITAPQPAEGLAALSGYASEIGAPLALAAPLPPSIPLGLHGAHQRLNAAVALGLADVFLTRRLELSPRPAADLASSAPPSYAALLPAYLGKSGARAAAEDAGGAATPDELAPFSGNTLPPLTASVTLTPAHLAGLAGTSWPGRAQTVTGTGNRAGCVFRVDGAHTVESQRAIVRWFAETASASASRHLVFNLTHARDAAALLAPVAGQKWASVTFCTNDPWPASYAGPAGDTVNHNQARSDELAPQMAMRDAWVTMTGSGDGVAVVGSVAEAVDRVAGYDGEEKEVLVTGSLYLAGALLQVLECPVA